MIIEDDRKMIELLSFFLEQAGYDTISALGGLQGLSLLEENPVDLIILDLMMPGMDGWTVLRTLKANEQLRLIPVVVVSARHPFECPLETASHAALFEGYLVKPFIVYDLLAQLGEVLN